MHVDMDAFFASIEQLDHPEYKGHPVIVGGLSSRGVVATCSYEARKFGVHSAMPISRAKKLCPDGIYVYPRMDRYKEVSHQIFSIMKEFTPHIEPLSVDEAFLEVSGMSTMYSGPKALGRAIKDRVFEETGLIISAGLAPNKFLAKLASDLDKPDGLVVIPYGREKEILAPNTSMSFFVPFGFLLVLSCMSLFHKSNAVSKNTCSWSDGVSNRFCRDTVVKSSYRTLMDTVCPKRFRFLNRFDKRFAKYLNSSSMALPSVKSSS